MREKEKLVKEIVRSLTEDSHDWKFDEHLATNQMSGIKIWIANTPILSLSIYQPTTVTFNLFDKFKIYQALSECRAKVLLKLLNK